MKTIRIVLVALTIPLAAGAQARPAAPKRGLPATDTAALRTQTPADTAHQVLINRETLNYDAAGHRDPFVSLMNTSELRPLLTELKLVAVAYDPVGGNSVAVLRDLTSKEQYRVRVGQQLGRMRVAAIHEKEVVFTIEEFGYSRQETLNMVDTTRVRPPR